MDDESPKYVRREGLLADLGTGMGVELGIGTELETKGLNRFYYYIFIKIGL